MFAYPKNRTVRVNLNKFHRGIDKSVDYSFSPESALDSYNFCYFDGALKDGFGIKPFCVKSGTTTIEPKLPDGETVAALYYYELYDNDLDRYDDRLIVYAKSGKMYELKLFGGNAFTLLDKSFSEVPKGLGYKLNGKDVFIFSDTLGVSVFDGENFSDYPAPPITSMCVHAERMFVTTGGEQTELWFSEYFDPTNWYVSLDKAGFIDFQDGLGKVNSVVEFDGYVYVIRDHGLTRLQGYFDQQDFYAENVNAGGTRIFARSLADCGKKLVYLCSDGFYSFEGSSVKRIMLGLDGALKGVDNSDAVGAYFDGKYYCSLNVKIGENVEKRTLCYDVNSDAFYLTKGFSVSWFLPIRSNAYTMLAVCDGINRIGELDDKCRLFGDSLKKSWVSAKDSFGSDNERFLSSMVLQTDGNITVNITSDLGSRKERFSGSEKVEKRVIGLKGHVFKICVESDEFSSAIRKTKLIFTE
ncbi:MAG: hypothetical protein IJ811_01635 [Clostridia bacterium]|nr:hypothetical protein [Clostridia bacterium]